MTTYRIDRLNKEFLRLIVDIISRRVKDDDAASAILTEVRASKDLSIAKVYFTLLDRGRLGTVLSALERAKGQIRRELGREMHIRQIPELRFIFDDSETRARCMDEIIDRVIKEDDEKRRENSV